MCRLLISTFGKGWERGQARERDTDIRELSPLEKKLSTVETNIFSGRKKIPRLEMNQSQIDNHRKDVLKFEIQGCYERNPESRIQGRNFEIWIF
jgi:hypothetical protein